HVVVVVHVVPGVAHAAALQHARPEGRQSEPGAHAARSSAAYIARAARSHESVYSSMLTGAGPVARMPVAVSMASTRLLQLRADAWAAVRFSVRFIGLSSDGAGPVPAVCHHCTTHVAPKCRAL